MRRGVALFLGPVWLLVSFGLMLQRVEPFATWFYVCAWYGLILTLDQVIRWREGRSLVRRCGPGFLLLLAWSAALWYFFELVNLRLQNWYYVFVAEPAGLRMVATTLAFGTVFPGIFWIEHLLALAGIGRTCSGPPLRLAPRGRLLVGVGLLCLVLPLLFPRYLFPLVWVALTPLLAVLERRWAVDGLLAQLERGEYGPLLRTLAAGLLAGFAWEFLNFWARAKWIYTVPFFDELKLFEMPLAGFLGFPPFAVECALVYRLLAHGGLAPRFGLFAQGPGRVRAQAGWAAAVALAFSVAVFLLMEGRTFTSTTPRVDRVAGWDPAVAAALRRHGVEYLIDLQGPRAPTRWRLLESDLTSPQLQQVRRLSALYLHQGIGTGWGNLLGRAGIGSLEDLGHLTVDQVRDRLAAIATDGQRLPTPAQVRIWLRRLPSPSGPRPEVP